ncbi:DUF998 domain-containing protein [Streptomyces sp. NRRL B-24484]|uniref:DUF998 domain-containing protein n=1 Tax=Streptomyces sp. NRRL B-24484 TaxID=1463833 RepID=UPI0004C28F1C|nr:DUF998 domain-containing protein [Streptomyces sp. NRRL B-24484]
MTAAPATATHSPATHSPAAPVRTGPAGGATTAAPGTRTLLLCGAVAGPLWAAVALAQAATRTGFDLTRHPLSALSNGDLGPLQIANFLLAGLLTVLGATGLHRTLAGTPGGRWAPRLVRTYGLGMIAAGVLVMDPADGFPVGTPDGMPPSLSWHAVGHLLSGAVSFTALIAACYVLGRHFARTGHRGRALASRAAGTALLLGDGWAMTGGPAGSLTLAIGAITAMVWVSAVAADRLR